MSSLANYVLPNGMLGFNSLDANDLELDGIPLGSGSGGGGGNASTWANYPAVANVSMVGNSLENVNQVGFNNVVSLTNASGQKYLQISDGTHTGTVYDSYFNVPATGGNATLRSVLLNNNNAQGANMQNVGTIGFSNGSGNVSIGSSSSGQLNVINSSGATGQVYSSLNPSITMISYYNQSNLQVIPRNAATLVSWLNNDSPYDTFGATPITFNSDNATFTNNTSRYVPVHVNGFISWSAPAGSTTFLTVFGCRVISGTPNTGSRLGYVNSYCPSLSQYPVMPFNFDLVMAPNDTIGIFVGHNDTGTLNINTAGGQSSRITVITY
jgi:hypothetical protein